MGVHEDTVHLIAKQSRLKDKYKDPDVLPKVNKAEVRAPHAYIIRKTITV